MKFLYVVFLVTCLVTTGFVTAEEENDGELDSPETQEIPNANDDVEVTQVFDIMQKCPNATCNETEQLECFDFCQFDDFIYLVPGTYIEAKCCMNNCGFTCKKEFIVDYGNGTVVTFEESELEAKPNENEEIIPLDLIFSKK